MVKFKQILDILDIINFAFRFRSVRRIIQTTTLRTETETERRQKKSPEFLVYGGSNPSTISSIDSHFFSLFFFFKKKKKTAEKGAGPAACGRRSERIRPPEHVPERGVKLGSEGLIKHKQTLTPNPNRNPNTYACFANMPNMRSMSYV